MAGGAHPTILEACQSHPAHVGVLEYIKKVKESSIAVDYESGQ